MSKRKSKQMKKEKSKEVSRFTENEAILIVKKNLQLEARLSHCSMVNDELVQAISKIGFRIMSNADGSPLLIPKQISPPKAPLDAKPKKDKEVP